MDMSTRVQSLDEAVCILHHTITLEKGVNPTFLSSVMDKY